MVEPSVDFAIEILQKEAAELERKLREVNHAIDSWRRGGPTPKHAAPSVSHPAVRAGQFKGMKGRMALQAYLNERPGGVLVTKATNDLASGGASLGQSPDRYRRHVRTTIKQNEHIFKYDVDSDTVSLWSEHGDSPNKKAS